MKDQLSKWRRATLKEKIYTAEDISKDLTAMIILFLTDIQQEIEKKKVPEPVARESSLLQKLGFSRSKNAQLANKITKEVEAHNKAYEQKKATLGFMQEAWDMFGNDTIVIRYDQFFELLRKYNLVCGSFDRYLGTIPEENLADIERVTSILEKDSSLVEPFRYITSIDTDRNNIDMLRHFNIYPMSNTLAEKLLPQLGIINFKPILSNRLLESSSFDLDKYRREQEQLSLRIDNFLSRQILKGRIMFTDGSVYENSEMSSDQDLKGYTYTGNPNLTENQYLTFIAAPAQEMENFSIKTYSSIAIAKEWRKAEEARRLAEAKRKKQEAKLERIRTLDPFICSLTPHGVMIFTKWGDEAQDSIIKRYEQLSEAVFGKGLLT